MGTRRREEVKKRKKKIMQVLNLVMLAACAGLVSASARPNRHTRVDSRDGTEYYTPAGTLALEDARAESYQNKFYIYVLSFLIPFYGYAINPDWGEAYTGLLELCVWVAMGMTACAMMG